MSHFHAVVWMDHQEAHVLMFDREHVESQRVKSRSHHKHQGKQNDAAGLYADVAKALQGTHEVLVTVEEGAAGGFGAAVLHHLAWSGHLDKGLKVRTMTMPDVFFEHAKPEEQIVEAHLGAADIAATVLKALGQDARGLQASSRA